MTFTATLNTSAGAVAVPNVSLLGRQSRILVSDYPLGADHTLLYASGDVATWATFGDGTTVLVLYLKEGQAGEFAFRGEAGLTFSVYGSPGDSSFATTTTTSTNGSTGGGGSQAFTYTQDAGATFVKFSNGVLAYLLSQETAWTFWAPPSTSPADDVYGRPDRKIFVLGSYLVRNATVGADDNVLHLSGDNNVTTTIEAYADSSAAGAAAAGQPLSGITWNGIDLGNVTRTEYGTYKAEIPGAEDRTIALPALADSDWQSADSLPEAQPGFDDSRWTVCNKTSSLAAIAPYTLPVLFSSDYGYYVGAKVYRGYFPSSGDFASVNITASGGDGFGWTAWLNGVLVGGDTGNTSALATTSAVLPLPADALAANGTDDNNVLTVLVDYHGHDEASTTGALAVPRGLYGAQLLSDDGTTTTTTNETGFTQWKIQGNAGGSANIDPVRGPMNEGGLYGERLGWHLPGFDPSTSYSNASSSSSVSATWDTSTPWDGLDAAGVRFYVTTFDLDLDADLDVPLGLNLSIASATTPARVMFWVNGYQYGKYVPHVGPQTVFPVPPGVVNNRGTNTLALSLWAMTDAGAALGTVELVAYGAYQTGFGFGRDWAGLGLQPGWTDRSAYV